MKITCAWLAVAAAACLVACGGASSGPEEIPLTVAKASCGSGDRPETALQGQVPAAMRTVGGFKGFNCNLELAGWPFR
jgi:hypothetical protein